MLSSCCVVLCYVPLCCIDTSSPHLEESGWAGSSWSKSDQAQKSEDLHGGKTVRRLETVAW